MSPQHTITNAQMSPFHLIPTRYNYHLTKGENIDEILVLNSINHFVCILPNFRCNVAVIVVYN